MHTDATVRTIVAATDFSENAEVALAWAVQLAHQHCATLALVHASQPEHIAPTEFGPLLHGHRDQIQTHVLAALEREAEQARRGGVAVDCEFAFGPAVEVVLAVAKRRAADVIVAGTRGHASWGRLLLGSTAARLVRDARCPVLTVHPADTPPGPVRTVLVPTDFSEDAALAADAAVRVLGGAGVDRRMVLLHSYDVSYEARYLPAPVLIDAVAAAEATVTRAIEATASKLRRTGIRVDTVTCQGTERQRPHRSHRGIGDGMHNKESDRNTGSPCGEGVISTGPP